RRRVALARRRHPARAGGVDRIRPASRSPADDDRRSAPRPPARPRGGAALGPPLGRRHRGRVRTDRLGAGVADLPHWGAQPVPPRLRPVPDRRRRRRTRLAGAEPARLAGTPGLLSSLVCLPDPALTKERRCPGGPPEPRASFGVACPAHYDRPDAVAPARG